MMKMITLIFTVCSLLGCQSDFKKIQVTERTSALLINNYSPADYDSVFVFANNKYLIKSKEFFDKEGKINHVLEWGGTGYTNWTTKMINETTDFFDGNNFTETIEAYLIDSHRVKVNSDTGQIKAIDERQKVVFYTLKQDQATFIHRLSYK